MRTCAGGEVAGGSIRKGRRGRRFGAWGPIRERARPLRSGDVCLATEPRAPLAAGRPSRVVKPSNGTPAAIYFAA